MNEKPTPADIRDWTIFDADVRPLTTLPTRPNKAREAYRLIAKRTHSLLWPLLAIVVLGTLLMITSHAIALEVIGWVLAALVWPEAVRRLGRWARARFSVAPPGIASTAPSPPTPTLQTNAEGELIHETVLQQVLAADFERYFPGYSLMGKEYGTNEGPIDLLGRDAAGNLLDVELKKSLPVNQVVGQVLRHVGALEQKFPGKGVRGVIVVAEVEDTLRYAVSSVASRVSLMTYQVQGSEVHLSWDHRHK